MVTNETPSIPWCSCQRLPKHSRRKTRILSLYIYWNTLSKSSDSTVLISIRQAKLATKARAETILFFSCFFSSSKGGRAPPSGWIVSIFVYFTGNGDKRDVSSENGEGSGGWSHPWDQGTRGHHRVHQAGADGKGVSRPVCWTGSNRVGDICVFYSLQKQESFLSFFSFVIWPHSFLPASLSGPGGFSQLLSVCESQVLAERERKAERFESLLFFSNLKLTLIREHTQDKDEG